MISFLFLLTVLLLWIISLLLVFLYPSHQAYNIQVAIPKCIHSLEFIWLSNSKVFRAIVDLISWLRLCMQVRGCGVFWMRVALLFCTSLNFSAVSYTFSIMLFLHKAALRIACFRTAVRHLNYHMTDIFDINEPVGWKNCYSSGTFVTFFYTLCAGLCLLKI